MPFFEFVVEGPLFFENRASEADLRKQTADIRAAAQAAWVGGKPPGHYFVTVAVTNYYRAASNKAQPPNVNLILKPLLEAMVGVVYGNINQVFHVTSDRVNLAFPTDAPSPIVENGLARFSEVLYVWVLWDEEA